MTGKSFFPRICFTITLFTFTLLTAPLTGQAKIKLGILHSESGTMAISEMPLIDVVLMAIQEINEEGGLLGRMVEAVKVNPDSDWPLFAEKAEELLTKHHVSAVFGCWTSVSRKHVIPIFEKHNGLLFYPVQYEGEECSYNVFYTGATPNQQAIPALDYLRNQPNGKKSRWILIGTDYIYPRTTNKVLRSYLLSKGTPVNDIYETYTPFGHSNWSQVVGKIKEWNEEAPVFVISTINGGANVHFYKELARQGIDASDVPVMAFSISEEELRAMDVKPMIGHLTAWNYYMSIKSDKNRAFIAKLKKYINETNIFGADDMVTNDPMEATYIGVRMWAQAVRQAGSVDVDAVRQALANQSFEAPSGFRVIMDPKNHHLHKPVFIGKIKANSQFEIVWHSETLIPAEPWSRYLEESKGKTADWTYPWLCGDCKVPRFR